MQKYLIDIFRTEFFPEIIADYLKGDAELKPFYRYSPTISAFEKAIEDFSRTKFNRKLLVDVLNEQYRLSAITAPSSVRMLSDENTLTVCTGHQLCLFTGPLFFIYKIISTVNLAEELRKKFPQFNFVPVYWMASEDHDFEEINHIHLFGKKIIWDNKQGGTAGRYVNSGIEKIIDELKNILGESGNAKQLLKLFADAYLGNKNLAAATRYLLNELFGKYGLVIIDGDNKRLKKEFASVMADDIFNHTNYKSVNETISQLDKLSYGHRVNPREINCFYLTENSRERIVFENSAFKINNTQLKFSEEEIRTEIESHSEKFSPNVVLRPLYQQKILPNIAYVGGPNEIAYWLEYKKMFEHHKINFPVLMLRNSVLWIDEKSDDRLQRLKIDYTDLLEDTDTLVKKILLKKLPDDLSLKDEAKKINTIFNDISLKVEKIDTTLKSAAEAELHRHLVSLKNLENKMLKAEKQKKEVEVNQIRKLKEKLFPDGKLQERFENFIPYYLKSGGDFFEILKNNLNPFDNNLLILREENQ